MRKLADTAQWLLPLVDMGICFLGEELLLFGNESPFVTAYDTVTNSWSMKAALESPTSSRCGHKVISAAGKVFMIGGRENNRCLKDLQVLSVNKWTPLAAMPHPVSDFGVASCDNCIYVFGGMRHQNYSRKVLKYDIVTNVWSFKTSMGRLTSGARAATLSGLIYVTGGRKVINGEELSSKDLDFYDPSADRWVRLASMASARDYHESFVFDGSIYVVGGCDRSFGLALDADVSEHEMERYDISLNKWSVVHLSEGDRGRPMRSDFGSLLIDIEMNLFDVCEYTH
jgi:N-acetylneuraminic acid mutarotase